MSDLWGELNKLQMDYYNRKDSIFKEEYNKHYSAMGSSSAAYHANSVVESDWMLKDLQKKINAIKAKM